MLLMAVVTGVMLSAIPTSLRARATTAAALTPVRHVENCRPFDQWLAEARRDLAAGRPHNALHDVSLSRRDCAYDVERESIEALAYADHRRQVRRHRRRRPLRRRRRRGVAPRLLTRSVRELLDLRRSLTAARR